ncbi:hypothetical protein A0H81_10963 [Grifola frondosa]|uniref:Uncharacterized protein n=1 Tax=Grifola frondosa TaxID=5627 RepID=A0A1C7LYR7_GRIFR|nr:hypothetical protein A0H81_10963 [Grifola frondosa]
MSTLGNAIHRDAEDDEPSLLSTDNEPPRVILTTPDRFRSNTPLLENDETTESTVSDSELFHLSVGLEDISHDLSDEEAPMDGSSASPTLAAQSPALTAGVIGYLGSESPSLASTAIASTIFESLHDGSPACSPTSVESPVEGSPAFTANIVESLRDESHAISSIVAESHAEMPARSLSPGTNTVVLEDDLSTSIDTSDPEVSQSPLASIHSPSHSHPSGLLSPIELAPSPPLCLPTEHYIDRDDSIDSGYADGWTGPTPLKRTPPRRLSTLSLLSSPFGTPSSRVLSAHFGNFDPSAPPAAAVFSPTFAAFQPITPRTTRDESGSSHAKSESKSEIGFKLSSPIIEASESAFSTKTLKEASTDVFGGTGYKPSPAGSLAYTLPVASPEGDLVFQDSSSPTLRVGIISAADNTDAVNTLYDGYYSPVSTDPAIHAVEASTARPDHHPELPDSQSHSSPTLVLTPLRVFSPSDASLRDSLVIKTSPAASQSVLQDRTPRVFSAGPRPEFVHQEQELPEGGSQHSSTNESSEKPTSTKVPFGFRHSVSPFLDSPKTAHVRYGAERKISDERLASYDPEEPLPSASHLKPLRLLSSPSSALIPARIRSPVVSPHDSLSHFSSGTPSYSPLSSGPVPRNPSWHRSRLSIISSRRSSRIYQRPDSRQSEPFALYDQLEEDEFESDDKDRFDETIRRPVSSLSTGSFRPPSVVPSPSHAIATPRPTLLFALASNDVDEVRRVLESGEARPNDDVGPQSALAFTLTSNQLTNKVAMVKLLLAHGADTSFLKPQSTDSPSVGGRNPPSSAMAKILENMDPAVR